MAVSIFLIFPRDRTRKAGISTWHPAGFCRTGCYGVIGPDPSAVLDKLKPMFRLVCHTGTVKLFCHIIMIYYHLVVHQPVNRMRTARQKDCWGVLKFRGNNL